MATRKKAASPRRRADRAQRRFIRDLARAISSMRQFNGLLQQHLAILARDSQAGISRLERGIQARPPNWQKLHRIAKALGWHMKVVFAEPVRGAPMVEVQKPPPGRKKVKAPPIPPRPEKPFSLADLEPWGMD